MIQALNQIVPARSTFVNDLAYESYQHVKMYDVQLPNHLHQKAPTSSRQ
jgi:hypothetical protein